MQTTYRLNTQELNMTFLRSLKSLFANQEVELIVRPINESSQIQDSEWIKAISSNPAFDFNEEKGKVINLHKKEKPLDEITLLAESSLEDEWNSTEDQRWDKLL